MWSTPSDRERAAHAARPLAARQLVFNRGFDAAVRALTRREGIPVNYAHPQYVRDRAEASERDEQEQWEAQHVE